MNLGFVARRDTYSTDPWQTEQRPEQRYSSDEAHRHREESPVNERARMRREK